MTDITKKPQSSFMHKLKIALLIFLPVAVLVNSVLWFFFHHEVNEEKNMELERFNKLFVDRELRIKKLKGEGQGVGGAIES